MSDFFKNKVAVVPSFLVNDRSRKILCTPEGGLTPRGEKAGFVTGITVPVDGGFLASAGV